MKTEIELNDKGWTVYLAHVGEKPCEIGLFVEDKDGFGEERAREIIARAYHLVKEQINETKD